MKKLVAIASAGLLLVAGSASAAGMAAKASDRAAPTAESTSDLLGLDLAALFMIVAMVATVVVANNDSPDSP